METQTKLRGWWWFIAHCSPVVFLILLNINTLMILMHAGITWWSQGRRWGQGIWWNAAKHRLFFQSAGDCSVAAEVGKESRQVIGLALHKTTSCWVKAETKWYCQWRHWHNHSVALLSHICPFPALWVFQQHSFLGFSRVSEQITQINRFVATLQAERPALSLSSIDSSGWPKSAQTYLTPAKQLGGENQLFWEFTKPVH